MLSRRNYVTLAVVTLVLLVVNGIIGQDHDVLGFVDDVLFFAFLACALLLVVMTVAILVRAATGRGRRSPGEV